MKFKGSIQLTLQGKLNKGLMLMEKVVLMPAMEQTSRENPNQAPFMGGGGITCDIFESTDLPTLITECMVPKHPPEKAVHQRELQTAQEGSSE